MRHNPTYGGVEFWSTKTNEDGFMGFVDKTWFLLQRIYTIVLFITVVLMIINAIFLSNVISRAMRS